MDGFNDRRRGREEPRARIADPTLFLSALDRETFYLSALDGEPFALS